MRDIVKEFGRSFQHPELFKPAFSISAFSFPYMPVISSDTPDKISLFKWGLIPFWVKNLEQAISLRQRTINARRETIFSKPAFRHSIQSKRCLVIADGFFEWRHFEGKKYPYYITLKTRTLFTLAGIWDSWTNQETSDTINTFSIITTDANELLARVHNSRKRMPVILPKNKETEWLGQNMTKEALKEMMQPYDTAEMGAHTVENKLNKLGYNTIDRTVTDSFEYPGLPNLD
jgi:putative SOS response-associated peptidase YedK